MFQIFRSSLMDIRDIVVTLGYSCGTDDDGGDGVVVGGGGLGLDGS